MASLFRFLLSLFLISLPACTTTTSKTEFFAEPRFDRSNVDLRRVAIVPNRLPLSLADPERWRRSNWEIAEQEFTRRGIDVVDYGTSVRVFQASGLPVDDTPATRDKFAELSEELGVDAIVVPYYGTMAATSGSFLTQRFNYTSLATFQFYLSRENQFFTRIDASGEDSYRLYGVLAFLGGLFLQLLSGENGDGSADLAALGTFAAVVADLYQGLIPVNRRWERAFDKGIRDGLAPFFAQYPGS